MINLLHSLGGGKKNQKGSGLFLPFLSIFALLAYLSFEVSFPLVKPIAWAALISFSIYPLYLRMRRRRPFRSSANLAAATITCLVVFLVLVPCFYGIFLAFKEGARLHQFFTEIMAAMETSGDGALAVLLPENIVEKIRPWMERYPFLRTWVRQGASWGTSAAIEAFGSTFSYIYYFTIIVVANFFLVRDGHRIVRFLQEIIPLPPGESEVFLNRARQILKAVVYGVILTALAQGAAGGIGWLIAGLPSPLLFGALMVFFALIPFLGTAIVWVPGAAYLLAVSDITGGILLLAWGILVVSMVGRFLHPYFISGGGNAHLFIVFIGVVGGLAAWGILGLFMGPLVVSLFFFLLENYRVMWRAWLESSGHGLTE